MTWSHCPTGSSSKPGTLPQPFLETFTKTPQSAQLGHWGTQRDCPICARITSEAPNQRRERARWHSQLTYKRWDMDTGDNVKKAPVSKKRQDKHHVMTHQQRHHPWLRPAPPGSLPALSDEMVTERIEERIRRGLSPLSDTTEDEIDSDRRECPSFGGAAFPNPNRT